MSTLPTRLETGASADIFYDAHDYDDTNAENTIETFQNDVAKAATLLRLVAQLNTTDAVLSPQDMVKLKAIQKDIKS